MKRILLVDSEHSTREPVRERLLTDGHAVTTCENPVEALSCLREGVDGVLISQLPTGFSSVELLQTILAFQRDLPVIMVCASTDETLEALREGAYYVTRAPLTRDEASILMGRALAGEARTATPGPSSVAEPPPPALVGESAQICAIRAAITRLSGQATTAVLLTGESGVGKTTIARTLHAQTNPNGPIVDLSSVTGGLAVSESQLEATLFGYEEGDGAASPGLIEQAEGGTLFLGEITEIPLPLQGKLSRFVEQRTFRRVGGTRDLVAQTRVVATSTRNLEAAVRDGLLRPEFAYRLVAVTLHVAPLRERRSDIPALVEHILAKLAASAGSEARGITEPAIRRLVEHSWPGNVRELENVLGAAVLLSNAERLDLAHLALPLAPMKIDFRLPSQGIDFRELERDVLAQALRLAGGNQTRAASLLGLTRDQIRYRMAKFGMTSRDGQAAARLPDEKAA
jgi:two-component system, NtrC family, response regulator AtoC